MCYPVAWFCCVTDSRERLHRAASAGRFRGLSNAEITDLFREYARRLDRADDVADWRVADEPDDTAVTTVGRRIEAALIEDIAFHKRTEAPPASEFGLLADDLDPDLSLAEVRRREFVRSITRCRRRGAHDEAHRRVDQFEALLSQLE